jgi:hypothetical protein
MGGRLVSLTTSPQSVKQQSTKCGSLDGPKSLTACYRNTFTFLRQFIIFLKFRFNIILEFTYISAMLSPTIRGSNDWVLRFALVSYE